MSLVEEITAKSQTLPSELQREILDFINFIARERSLSDEKIEAVTPQQSGFRSVRGILQTNKWENLEEDLTAVRREMWRNFPREELP